MNNLEQYIEILEKYVSIDWNDVAMYEKMLKEIFKQYEENKNEQYKKIVTLKDINELSEEETKERLNQLKDLKKHCQKQTDNGHSKIAEVAFIIHMLELRSEENKKER